MDRSDVARIAFGHAKCSRWDDLHAMLRDGLDVGIKNEYDRTLLHYASGLYGRHSASTVRLLLSLGASVNARERLLGWTPLHFACWGGTVNIVRDLIAAGADVNARNRGRDPPLFYCSEGGDGVARCAELLSHPAVDLLATNSGGETAEQNYRGVGSIAIADMIATEVSVNRLVPCVALSPYHHVVSPVVQIASRRRWSELRAGWVGGVVRGGWQRARAARTSGTAARRVPKRVKAAARPTA